MAKSRTIEPPILTRAESEVMSVLWSKQSATVHDVLEALPRDAAYTSVLTVLRILEKKGYVEHRPDPGGGRAHVYSPCVPATKARRLHVRDLIDRLFGGSSEELVVGLLEDESLSRAELQQMKELIEGRLGGSAAAEATSAPDGAQPARSKRGKKHVG
jgi:predicted transcriptional regulator